MSLLSEIKTALSPLNIPLETGVFKDNAPDEYIVLTPISDTFELFADNAPLADVEEVRISLFVRGNYLTIKNRIVRTLFGADITITDRRYIGHEDDTDYHHYAIDVAKYYQTQEVNPYGNNRT